MQDRLIYYIFDTKAQVKTSVFLSQNDATAVRSLQFQIKGLERTDRKDAKGNPIPPDSVSLTILSDSELWKVDQGKFVKVKDIGEMIVLKEPESN